MGHDARAVANYFLDLARKKGVDLTPMKLIKLVYIAHGWTLGLMRKPLIIDKIEAWKYGPVIPSLYKTFKKYGDRAIYKNATNCFGVKVSDEISDQEKAIIERVFEKYGNLTALQLSSLTHKEGTPWYISWNNQNGMNQMGFPISNELIEDHYVRKSQK